MKQFNDVKALAADFTATAMQTPRCPDGNIIYICKLVNAKLTIRCIPTQDDVKQRAAKLIKAYNVASAGTSMYKEWRKAQRAGKITTKRPAFSWDVVKDLLAESEPHNTIEYFKLYDRQPSFCVGTIPSNDKMLVDVQSVPSNSNLVTGKLFGSEESLGFVVLHVPSGMSLASKTESATRAGSLKLLDAMDQEVLAAGIEKQKDNTYQIDKLTALGFIL